MKKSSLQIFSFVLLGLFLLSIIFDFVLNDLLTLKLFFIKYLEIILGFSSACSLSVSISIKSVNITSDRRDNCHNTYNVNISGPFTSNGLIALGSNANEVKGQLKAVDLEINELKEENIEKICDIVAEKLMNETKFNQIDKDFVLKFLNDAAFISEEDIQKIWAQLLVTRVTTEESVSKRLLDIVKNLSSSEAEIFKRIASYSTSDGTIFDNFRNLLSFNEISTMIEIGLVKPHDLLTEECRFTVSENIITLTRTDEYIIAGKCEPPKNTSVSYSCAALTNEGLMLKKALKITMSLENVIILAKELVKETKDKQILISVHKIINIDGDRINFENENLLKD